MIDSWFRAPSGLIVVATVAMVIGLCPGGGFAQSVNVGEELGRSANPKSLH